MRPFLFVALGLTLVACSASAPSEDPNPAPAEPIVYAASADTRADVGIATWGVDPDTTTMRGYDAKNAVVAEVHHFVEKQDDQHEAITVSMTGTTTASQRLAYGIDGAQAFVNQTENTFLDNDLAKRILRHMSADAAMTDGAALLGTSSVRPLDAESGNTLIDYSQCSNLSSACRSQLLRARSQIAEAEEACTLVNTIGRPLLGGAGGARDGAELASEFGLPGIILGGLTGAVVETLPEMLANTRECLERSYGTLNQTRETTLRLCAAPGTRRIVCQRSR